MGDQEEALPQEQVLDQEEVITQLDHLRVKIWRVLTLLTQLLEVKHRYQHLSQSYTQMWGHQGMATLQAGQPNNFQSHKQDQQPESVQSTQVMPQKLRMEHLGKMYRWGVREWGRKDQSQRQAKVVDTLIREQMVSLWIKLQQGQLVEYLCHRFNIRECHSTKWE